MQTYKVGEKYFRPEEIEHGGMAATDEFLFRQFVDFDTWKFMVFGGRGGAVGIRFSEKDVPFFARLIPSGVEEAEASSLREQRVALLGEPFETLLSSEEPSSVDFGAWR